MGILPPIFSPSYKDVVTCERWKSFQNFSEDIKSLTGYSLWKESYSGYEYDLDKDIKVKGNKVYSKETCMFVSRKENTSRENKKQALTGKKYLAIRLSDNYREEFTNQRKFSEKYNLHSTYVSRVINKYKGTTHHKGWTFEVVKDSLK